MTWDGWLTCANCSSLGLDKWVGTGKPPKFGKCSSCDGPWPLDCGLCMRRGWIKLVKPGSVPPVYMAAWCDCPVGQELRAAVANGSPADDRALELLHAAVVAAQHVHDAGIHATCADHDEYSAAFEDLRAFIWKQVG